MILLSLLFCFMVFFQDNHKLVKARFVWWVVGWRLSGFSLRVVSGISSGYVFLRSVHTFSWFLKSTGVVILVTPKQEMERKSEWFCGVNFFRSNFKVEWENGVWTKIRSLGSGFFVHMPQFHSDFYCFFDLLDRIFF